MAFLPRFVALFVNCDNRTPFSVAISCNMRLISSIEKFALQTQDFFAVAAMLIAGGLLGTMGMPRCPEADQN